MHASFIFHIFITDRRTDNVIWGGRLAPKIQGQLASELGRYENTHLAFISWHGLVETKVDLMRRVTAATTTFNN